MANELPNAVALMQNDEFRSWVMAASVYQARQVIIEPASTTDHTPRVSLANSVVMNPTQYLERFVNVIACDPGIASLGTTVQQITQPTLLQKMSDIWTPLSKVVTGL